MILLNKFISCKCVVVYGNNDMDIYIGKKWRFFIYDAIGSPVYTEHALLNIRCHVKENEISYSWGFDHFQNEIYIINSNKNVSFYIYNNYKHISRNLSKPLYYCLYNLRYSKDKQYQDKYRNVCGNMEI